MSFPALCRIPLFASLLASLLLAACAPAKPERPRFFWPPAGGQEKIEYINFYQSDSDVRREANTWLADALLGTVPSKEVFGRPQAIASDGAGRVFVSDTVKSRVFVYDLKTFQIRALTLPDGKFPVLKLPMGLAVDAAGQVFVADSQGRQILLFGRDEKLKRSFGHADLQRPTGLTFDSPRQRLYVADTGGHKVMVFTPEGQLLRSFGQRGGGPGEFNFPLDVAVDEQGHLYVLDAMNARVQVFDTEGSFLRQFGERGTASGSFQIPKAIAVSPSGHVYVVDSQANRFVIFDSEGRYLLTVGAQAALIDGKVTPGGFYMPNGIDVDRNDTIWVVDSMNRMFHQFQYLSEDYLKEHPILPGQSVTPDRQ